jgi:hypothetical protein
VPLIPVDAIMASWVPASENLRNNLRKPGHADEPPREVTKPLSKGPVAAERRGRAAWRQEVLSYSKRYFRRVSA